MSIAATEQPKPKRSGNWVEQVAQAAHGQGAVVASRLGINADLATSKAKFFLPGCTNEKPKAKISDPESGFGGTDCLCPSCRKKTWLDWVALTKHVRQLPTQGDAAELVSDWIGHKIPERGTASNQGPAKSVQPQWKRNLAKLPQGEGKPTHQDLIAQFCETKQGVTPDACERLDVHTALYRCKAGSESFPVIVIPVYGEAGNVVNAIVARPDGSLIPTFNEDGTPGEPAKFKVIGGSTKGILCTKDQKDAFLNRSIPKDATILKTEGPSCLLTLVASDQAKELFAWTNPFGARDYKKQPSWMVELFAGRSVHIVHDADDAGQQGVDGWAKLLGGKGCDPKRVKLQFDEQGGPGKDLRDYLNAGRTVADLMELIDAAESIAAGKVKLADITEPDDPARLASGNLANYRAQGRDIRYWKGRWWTYKTDRWTPRTAEYMRARMREHTEAVFESLAVEDLERYEHLISQKNADLDKIKKPKKRKVTGVIVRNALEALETICLVPDHIEFGCMLSTRTRRDIWPVANGLLDLDALKLEPHTSDWWSDHCNTYQYDLAADCPKWLAFLNDVFRDPETREVDRESIELLKRWFGYCLMQSTRLQKMLIMDGVSRSGKGVIVRILKRLIGEHLTASPRLRDFCGDFGLQPLIGKRLGVIGDARLNHHKHDTDSILEVLLGIIGEDSQDVNLKGKAATPSTNLPIKFMLVCNGIPTLNDPATAIVNRVVILKFNNSFAGREDTTLTDSLLGELDGIFVWAMQGYDELRRDFRLRQPASGEEALNDFRKQVAPIRCFVEEWCHLRTKTDDPVFLADRDEAYDAWRAFCEQMGRSHPGTKRSFVRQLTIAYPSISETRPRVENGESRRYQLDGIELGEEAREAARFKKKMKNEICDDEKNKF